MNFLNFLNEKEKRILAKLVFSLGDYQTLLHSDKLFTLVNSKTEYVVQSGYTINPQNPENSFLLLKPLENNKAIVIAGGSFSNISPQVMTNKYKLNDEAVSVLAHHIYKIIVLVNDLITITGKYFIINSKLLRESIE